MTAPGATLSGMTRRTRPSRPSRGPESAWMDVAEFQAMTAKGTPALVKLHGPCQVILPGRTKASPGTWKVTRIQRNVHTGTINVSVVPTKGGTGRTLSVDHIRYVKPPKAVIRRSPEEVQAVIDTLDAQLIGKARMTQGAQLARVYVMDALRWVQGQDGTTLDAMLGKE